MDLSENVMTYKIKYDDDSDVLQLLRRRKESFHTLKK